ncbi:MAG: hypothetical protein B7Z78_05885 [Rhodospirillales bacterium 20-60-12]|nr:MAG: hypothetical protein B7Z78_05885 [Rhodospirillales bacterium 20-60-12]HQT68280.1 heme biosynthesis HemY N-terminal domain-containing protein [Acetobacteraceae bacterium]HQU00820.1 heme biosynthesis HemY N-terminal domain-containing protein [Acetobacteraceae bacterium]
MFRAFKFIIIAALLLALAWWIGSLPGHFEAQAGGLVIDAGVPVAVFGLIVLVFVLVALVLALRGLWRLPGRLGARRQLKRKTQADQAILRSMAGLAAGDGKTAEAEARKARKYTADAPLSLLVSGNAARMQGKHDEAHGFFTALSRHRDAAFLGWHGLLHHAAQTDDHAAAADHAVAAADAYPGSVWVADRRLDLAVRRQDWPAAIALARTPAATGALCAAASGSAPDPQSALRWAKQAVKAAPMLAPARVALARALRRGGRERAARKTLLAGWQTAPQPMLADEWLSPQLDKLARAKAAQELTAGNPEHFESALLMARTSLDAKLLGEARRHAERCRQTGTRDRRFYMLLADLTDAEPGHDSEHRAALRDAVNAPEPAWVCDQCATSHAAWQPSCRQCGKPGGLIWKADAVEAAQNQIVTTAP